MRELTAEQVGLTIDPSRFEFSTTDELQPLDRIVGQPRALDALDLGLGIRHPSYNIYVAGLEGMGRMGMIRSALDERVEQAATPPDWVYVNNFDEADRPLAISLQPGRASKLKQDLQHLVHNLQEELPKAFEAEDLSREKQRLSQKYQQMSQEIGQQVEQIAQEKGLTVQQLATGQMALVPVRDGEPMRSQDIEQLSDEERADVQRRQQEVAEQATSLMSRQQELSRQFAEEVSQVERNFAARYIEPLIEQILARYENPKLLEWLNRLKEDLIENADRFRQAEGGQQQQVAQMLGISPPGGGDRFAPYQVNVLVDNSQETGAPVIVEDVPNYKNLFGIIDRTMDPMGRATTDFTHIKGGSLLRANGGYVVFNLLDALIEPAVWKELKRTIKSGRLQIEAYEPLGMFSTTGLRPEPIPLDVKLVVVGNPLVYHLLHLLDEDFSEIFKVKAEFSSDMDREDDAGSVMGQLLQKLRHTEGERLMPFRADGVARLVHAAARFVDDQYKLTGEFNRVADLAREADYWARREGTDSVRGEHVLQAMEHKVFRSDLVAANIREMIADGRLRITLDRSVIGQVNGLAVADLGDYTFGRPSRVTASVGAGTEGLVNIERESKLSGRTFDKGMLILEGYFRNTYAGRRPVAFSAGLTMEQSYGLIDGDSATAAELYSLLSVLAEVPLRQDIAVTGSVNQWGEIQAVGGINAKIEGFFDVCRQQGLTGDQGVAIPASNERNLVLRPDVVEAVGEGRFHVWTVDHVDQGLELLSGLPAGMPDQKQTVHGRVNERLGQLTEALKAHQAALGGRFAPPLFATPERPGDPRPPLPGRGE